MTTPKLRQVVTNPDTCANCVYLAWGVEQGEDYCKKHGLSICWGVKKNQVCDDHERSPLKDPRGR